MSTGRISIIGVLALIICATNAQEIPPPPHPQANLLTNSDVLAMLSGKLSSDVILAKLETSQCEFDTSPNALATIKAAGATDAVLIAILKGCGIVQQAALPEIEVKSDVIESRENSEATVYFFRESAFEGMLRKVPVFIDDVQVADLKMNKFFSLRIVPGKHTLRSATKKKAISVEIQTGQTYYFRGEIVDDGIKAAWRITQVADVEGATVIATLQPLDPKLVAPVARPALQ